MDGSNVRRGRGLDPVQELAVLNGAMRCLHLALEVAELVQQGRMVWARATAESLEEAAVRFATSLEDVQGAEFDAIAAAEVDRALRRQQS